MTDTRKLRILLVTRNMPPLVGGMERLNWHMADELSRHAEVRVIAPQGSAATAPPDVRVIELPLRPLWKFFLYAQWYAWREARRWRPDLLLAGSGLTALPVWLTARLARTRAAAYVHGLDLAVPHPIYRKLWLPALRRMDCVIANSLATGLLAERVGVERTRIGIVHPGVEVPKSLPDVHVVARFRTEHGLRDHPVLLSVGRLSTRKGLREFVTNALPRVAAVYPNVILLIVGDAPVDALYAEAQSLDSILAAAERVGVAGNVRFLGTITDYYQLGIVYRAADVHVFPVRDILGDPEGFGMVAVEAAAHGLPTVAFATGGVIDAVAEGVSGQLVESGNYLELANAIIETVANGDSMTESCKLFAGRFAWPCFGASIREMLAKARD